MPPRTETILSKYILFSSIKDKKTREGRWSFHPRLRWEFPDGFVHATTVVKEARFGCANAPANWLTVT
jgi:hypothetical protein